MPEKLMKFLCELAVDSERLADYQRNPEAVMKKAGLDQGECTALTSGDPLKVHASLMGDAKRQRSGDPKPPPSPDFWVSRPNAKDDRGN
jgi:hypothetical protein